MLADARVEELHGVTVGQAIVGGLIDLAHPAAADPADDAVRPPDQRTWLYTGHHCRPIVMGSNVRFQRSVRGALCLAATLTCGQKHTFMSVGLRPTIDDSGRAGRFRGDFHPEVSRP